VFAEITEYTLQAIPAILDPSQDGCHDTGNNGTHADQPEPMWDLGNTPRLGRVPHSCALERAGQ
jgi:hypothetical protein